MAGHGRDAVVVALLMALWPWEAQPPTEHHCPCQRTGRGFELTEIQAFPSCDSGPQSPLILENGSLVWEHGGVVGSCVSPAEGSSQSPTVQTQGHWLPNTHLFLGRQTPHQASWALSPKVGRTAVMPWTRSLVWKGDIGLLGPHEK